MSDDIVDRLRADIRIQEEALMCEAADTIERLRESQQAAEVEIADLREYAKSCEAVIDGLHITYGPERESRTSMNEKSATKRAKFAPADAAGNKPYVRSSREFRWEHSSVVYAKDAKDARYAFRIGRYESVTVRRATVEDMETIRVEPMRGPVAAAVVGAGKDQK